MINELEGFDFNKQEIPEDIEGTFRELFEAKKDSMINAAISAYARAEHPLHTHVGCSIMTLRDNFDLSEPELFTGANWKQYDEMLAFPERKCAEMQALMSSIDPGYIQKEKDGETVEQGGLKKGGIIVAVVTVSELRNTGETDTVDHDVIYPCKQCQEVYEEFLNTYKRVSPKTIIFNARINGGRVVAHSQITVRELLEKFKDGKELRKEATIKELLETIGRAFNIYKNDKSAVVRKLGSFGVDPVPPILPGQADIARRLAQRERVEAILQAKELFIHRVINAIKSAAEEGVEKVRIIDSLGLDRSLLDRDVSKGFSESELDKLGGKYLELLEINGDN